MTVNILLARSQLTDVARACNRFPAISLEYKAALRPRGWWNLTSNEEVTLKRHFFSNFFQKAKLRAADAAKQLMLMVKLAWNLVKHVETAKANSLRLPSPGAELRGAHGGWQRQDLGEADERSHGGPGEREEMRLRNANKKVNKKLNKDKQ